MYSRKIEHLMKNLVQSSHLPKWLIVELDGISGTKIKQTKVQDIVIVKIKRTQNANQVVKNIEECNKRAHAVG